MAISAFQRAEREECCNGLVEFWFPKLLAKNLERNSSRVGSTSKILPVCIVTQKQETNPIQEQRSCGTSRWLLRGREQARWKDWDMDAS
jgi:hypothetical protein